jgi:hypothetical protein
VAEPVYVAALEVPAMIANPTSRIIVAPIAMPVYLFTAFIHTPKD